MILAEVLILGASSAIAEATARRLASSGASLFLVARDPARLDIIADDLRVRGAPQVHTLAVNLTERDRHPEIAAAVADALPALNTVLIAHGVLPDPEACEANPGFAVESLDVNFVSVVSLAGHLTPLLAQRSQSTFAVISSVAGDRGRQSNYIYGAAKGGLNVFLDGLRNRLWPSGVNVLTITPGFVDTPMTAHIEAKGPLWAQPDDIAAGIVAAIEKRRSVVYLPAYWRLIMFFVRNVPDLLFKRLKL